ncbi:ribonuclease III [Kangiella sp. HZ709]|uniref:ribonuclease III n=1 Tax=Kangiella sp. HZ709 TaxID=2666328 RepID=UPI0012AFBEC4|nr:ribonuclease III [Kangiella sp. HZ709]MRX27346.1 ribonuclease III [Kangiella sp. HZ709]
MPAKKNLQERLLRRLGYQFRNTSFFKRALTHRSASSQHNERLEFLGDAILGMVIAEALFEKFPKVDEGKLSRLRASLVKGKTLSVIAQEIELGDCLFLGDGELKTGGYRRGSILADAFEALIGAIYQDSGFESVKDITLGLYEDRLKQLSIDTLVKDPKTRLQEWLQSRKLELPEYQLTNVTGEAHEQHFEVKCEVEYSGKKLTVGAGASRRSAEQIAAETMLNLLLDLQKSQ